VSARAGRGGHERSSHRPAVAPRGAGFDDVASAATAPGRIPEWLPLTLVLAATVVLYLPALGTQFFADDFLFLDQVRDRSLWDAIRTPDPLSNFFRPVSRQLYFWAIAGLTHESPLAFRIGNLVTLLCTIVLLALLVQRMAGTRAACIAAGFFSLHYAADVPVRWACGSQELLAVAGALAAIYLHVTRRRVAAGVAMLAAAFSKEVVLLTPVIATLADHAPREPWRRTLRRAWPLAAAVAGWAIVFIAMPHRRVAQATEVEFSVVQSPLAALAHLLQVVPGIEWLPGRFGAVPRELPPLLPTLAVLVAVAIAWRGAGAAAAPEQERHALRVAAVWILLGTVPVAAVALLWNSYYYLFAITGVALALGVVLSRAPAWAACGTLALLAWGSANARALGDFGTGRNPWTPVSHINRTFIERANRISARYLASIRRAYPRLPRGSAVFFAGLQSNIGFQRANGPLLRWGYRDSSLRSYFLNEFSSQTIRSRPLFFFVGAGDSLAEMERGDDLFMRIAYGMIVSGQARGARDALDLARQQRPGDLRPAYWQSWLTRALGDTAAADRQLAALGFPRDSGARSSSDQARGSVLAQVAGRDTAGAIALARRVVWANVHDAGSHGLLADLLLVRSPNDADGAIEALAARVLAPGEPYAWRRWAVIQGTKQRYLDALDSFDRYFKLGGEAAAADAEAHAWVERVRGLLPKDVADRDDDGQFGLTQGLLPAGPREGREVRP